MLHTKSEKKGIMKFLHIRMSDDAFLKLTGTNKHFSKYGRENGSFIHFTFILSFFLIFFCSFPYC